MDNGDSLLDVIDDTSDLFGNQNENHGSLFNWADEFLGDETDISSNTVAAESGNLATNVNQSNLLLTTQNYAVTSSIPTQNITLSTSQFLSKSPAVVSQQKSAVVAQTVVNPTQTAGLTTQIVQQGNQHFIVRTPSGNQIQVNRQAQFQQQVLQPQQNIVTNSSFSQILAQQNPSPAQTPTGMNRSLTPNSAGLSYGGAATVVSQTVTQMRSSPAPNVNLVHLPPNVQTQQQQQVPQQQQQFQIAPGTILQIPTAAAGTGQNIVNTTLLQQGQQALLGNTQQGTLVNAQNTVIQNPNVVNVNVAAPHVLCSSPAQQQRTNLGLSNIQTATPSPFNIQGTLIQTAEGKSILIPSQNLAQPINIQGLSVATPIAQPQIQQPAQNTVSNMLHLAQPQQHSAIGVDNRTNQGVQQIVLNHQGQQILVQRAQTPGGQPQNIIVRTAGGPSGIVQLQQRTAQPTPVQSAQQTLQALAAGNSHQLKLVNQQGTAQTGVPVINIGGQNVTLQQLSSQLGNIQGLQLQQPQVQQQQQHQLQQQQQQQQSQQQPQLLVQTHQQDQINFQNQSHQSQASSGSHLTFSQGQMNVQQQGQSNLHAQQNVNSSQNVLGQTQVNTSVNSVENQTRLILQQIHDSLKKSQASAVSSVSATVSNIQAIQNKNSMNIKQEFQTSCSSSISNDQTNKSFLQPVAVKSEPNLIETLIKQENNPRSNFVSQASSVHDLLTCNAQATHVTTTVSQASTHMSMFVLSNSQNVLSNTSTTSTASIGQSVPFGQSENTGTMPDINNSSIDRAVQDTQPVGQHQGAATLQTIHLQPELQQQFQRVQLEIRKVQAATNMTSLQKQDKLQKLQLYQKRVLLKGRVLATTKAEPHQIQQGLAALTQSGPSASFSASPSINSSIAQLQSSLQSGSSMSSPHQQPSTSQFSPGQSNMGLKNLLKQDDTQVQPDSTSSLGQVPQNANSLSTLLGSPASTAATANQLQMPSSSQSVSASQHMISANQRIVTPSQSIAPPSQNVAISQSSPITSTAASAPQVAVPTQIKIADKVLTLSLTPAQKEKVQSYLDRMTPEQQLQYLQTQQHVLQRIQKQQALNAQIRAQVEAQKKQAALSGQGEINTLAASRQNAQNIETTQSENTVFKPEVKTIPIPNTSINTQPTDTPVIRTQKRSYMDIPKGTLINQQIRQDQNHASNPDTKRPFRSRGDACRRLLRYHVFQNYGPSQKEFAKFDGFMEDTSADLLKKKDRMFEKFRHLLFQETLRVQPSSELVMLQRMQNQDLRKTLEEEKLQVKTDPESFNPMPMKFLCKEEADKDMEDKESLVKKELDNSSDTNTSMEEGIQPIKMEIKEEVVDLDDSSSEARAAKMRKLVIKTDGMNFSSCFKRMSMDSSRSSVDEKVGLLDDSETNDYDNERDIPEIKHSDHLTALDDDDDNTNEYSRDKFDSFDNEAERAALAISSAEESLDTDIDSKHGAFGINSRLARHSSLEDTDAFQNRRNFELASESMYYNSDSDKSKDTKDFPNISRHASVDGSKTYIPKHSVSVSNGSVLDSGNTDDSDMEDKYDMYQPITESLTDSEENSYYSADNAADQRSVMIDDDDDDLNHGQWNKNDPIHIPADSDQESDQEVKAQMESAINSILSLSQGASNNPDAVYSYSQSNHLYNHDSQSNSLYSDSNELQAELDFQTDHSQSSMEVTTPSGCAAGGEFSSDLDAAVNSILM